MMTSKNDSPSRHGHDERKSMRQKIKGIFGHRKDTITPQEESPAVQSSQGASVHWSRFMLYFDSNIPIESLGAIAASRT